MSKRTLMVQAAFQKFVVFAMMTAIHLISRLPSRTIVKMRNKHPRKKHFQGEIT